MRKTGLVCRASISRLLCCLVCAILAGHSPARAVYYADVPDMPITEDGIVIRFLGSDILLSRGSVIYPDRTVWTTYAGGIYGEARTAVQGRESLEALPFARGEAVGPEATWTTLLGRLVYVTCPQPPGSDCASTGPWAGGDHYLGLWFRDEQGTRYGWARIGHAGGTAPAILYEIAIETTPDLPILAGARETLPALIGRALKCAAGLEIAAPDDVALLDRSGAPGALDLLDAAALVRLLAPPAKT